MSLSNADALAKSGSITQRGKLHDSPLATLEDIDVAFRELLHLEDDMTMRALLAAVIANRMPDADPVWLLLVAPSASAKTEYIMGISMVPGTYLVSQITPNTFLSGMANQKKDPSLLTRLGSDAILLQKDFTTIISMRPDSRGEILAQLREVFDGRFVREFGTGQTKAWEGRLGFISGVTLEIEQAIMTGSRLGDRFLYFRLPPVDDRKAMKKASKNLFRAAKLRAEIQEKVAGYLNDLDIPDNLPDLPEQLMEAIRSLCAFIVQARSPVIRDQYGTKDIIDVPVQEGPTRFYKEIMSMAHALAVMRGGAFDDVDYEIVAKLAFDAIPRRRLRVMDALYMSEDYRRTGGLAMSISLPTRTVHFILDELECCGIVERRAKDGDKGPDEWRMTWGARKLMAYRNNPTGMSVADEQKLKRAQAEKGEQIKAKPPNF